MIASIRGEKTHVYSAIILKQMADQSEVVHRNLINCQAYANFKSQICEWERLTVFSQQLPQEP